MEKDIEITNLNEIKEKLWKACDQMRGNISSEQYMHIIIGIIFLKTISDKKDYAYQQFSKEFESESDEKRLKKWDIIKDDLEFLDKYGIKFLVPSEASWEEITKYIGTSELGTKIDEAFLAIEKNENLKGLFDKNFNREELDKIRLGNVIKEFTNINFSQVKEDFIGRLYEYFLGNFFRKLGQKGGEFYTPHSVVELMVAILNPESDSSIYDPCCGTGGMFIQAKQYLQKNNLPTDELKIYGQEFQNQTWKLARINLILNGFDPDDTHLGLRSEDTFNDDLTGNKKFDIVLANPPFNVKKWQTNDISGDPRFAWGMPPEGNGNYAWISHIVYKLNRKGRAAIVLANGSVSSSQKNELAIRKKMLEENKIEAIISLPDKLFYTTGIAATIWIFNNQKENDDFLLINAEELGELESKKLRHLTKSNIEKIVDVYKQFREGKKINEKDLARSVSLDEIKENDYSLVPGRYIEYSNEDIDKEEIIKEILEIEAELNSLFKDFSDLIPQVQEAIKKSIEYSQKTDEDEEK